MLFDCIISQLIVKGISKIHLISLVLMRDFSKITPSLFTIKEGSTSFPKPLSPQGTGDVPTALLGAFFRKPTSPPLPLREGPPLISVFSPQGRRGNRSSSSLVTISFHGWRTIRGLRQQLSCGFLCGDKPAFTQGLA